MATSSYTQNIGLCQWSSTDKPKRTDFVNDNIRIDTQLGNHLNNNNIHVTAEEKEIFGTPYSIVGYAGDGNASQVIQLDNSPKLVIVFQKYYPPVQIDSNHNAVSHLAIAGRTCGSSGSIQLNGSSLIVTQDTTPTDGVINNFNEEYGQYIIIAFR